MPNSSISTLSQKFLKFVRIFIVSSLKYVFRLFMFNEFSIAV
jgi:hypothetical protein